MVYEEEGTEENVGDNFSGVLSVMKPNHAGTSESNLVPSF